MKNSYNSVVQKKKNLIKNWAEEQIFPKMTYRWPRSTLKGAQPTIIRETHIKTTASPRNG